MKKFLRYLTGFAVSGLLMTAVSAVSVSAEEPLTVTEPAITEIAIPSLTDITVTNTTDVSPDITETYVTSISTDMTKSAETPVMSETTAVSETLTTTVVTSLSEQVTEISSETVSETTVHTSVSETTTTVSSPFIISGTITFSTNIKVTCPAVTPDTVQGWNSINGKWFYYNGWEFLTGVHQIDEEYYIFAQNGAMRTGWQTVNSKRCYYDNQTHSPVYGWINHMGGRYYNDKILGKLTGYHKIDGKGYVFNTDGRTAKGFTLCGNYMYYCNEQGVVQCGYGKNKPITINGKYYLISTKGHVLRGWQTVNGKREFYDFQTGQQLHGWIKYHDNMYFVGYSSGKYTGVHYINGHPYLFDKSGIYQTGLQYIKQENVTSYFYDNGTRAVSKLIRTDDKIYYFDENGFMQTGWVKIDGNTYYFNPDGTQMLGFQEIDGYTYYFGKDGKMRTGIQIVEDSIYHFNPEGKMSYGWITINDKTYYFDKSQNGAAVKNWQKIDGDTYYFDTNCIMATGIKRIDEKTYYLGTDGKLRYNWVTVDEKTYYFDKAQKGAAATEWQKIDGATYYFNTYGVMATEIKRINDKTYYFGANGKLRYGWVTVDNRRYYFNYQDGAALIKWQKIDGNTYFFDETGIMYTGKVTTKGKTYYFGKDGKMRTGWQKIDGKKYYFDPNASGAMVYYRHQIDGINYLFDSTGALVEKGNQVIVNKALSQVGQVGGQPYWSWWGLNYRIEWCACFVSWCASQCGYTQKGQSPEFVSCKVGIDWFKKKNQWMGKNYTPKSGDYIFFDWDIDGTADHVGIVDYCENGYVFTVEGNSNDRVRKDVYYADAKFIFGYAATIFS